MPRNPKKAVGPRPTWTKTEVDDLVLWRETLGLPLWAIERLMPGRSKIGIKNMIKRMGLKVPEERGRGFRFPPRPPMFGTLRDEIDAARMEAKFVLPFRPPPVETLVIETW